MFKKILIPMDVSKLEHAEESLKIARKLLSAKGEISVLNIVQNLPEEVIAELPGRYIEATKSKARHKLSTFLTEHDYKANLLIEVGNPASLIVDLAEREGFDLIIIASHKPNMMNYILGSTADRVVRKAKCPILITR